MRNDIELENHLLIATPQLVDPALKKSVIYICKADKKLVKGIVINKPMQHMLSDLLHSQNIATKSQIAEEMPVLLGGKVSKERGFIIHTDDDLDNDGALPNVSVSTSKDMLEHIAEGGGPKNFLISLGYTSWETGELLSELTFDNHWLIAPATRRLVFHTPYSIIWQMAAASIGVNFNYFPACSGTA